MPADADSDPAVTLTSVTCSSAGSCEAVGAYDQSSDNGYGEALIETLSLGTWTATAAPLPGKAAQYDSALESITCLASEPAWRWAATTSPPGAEVSSSDTTVDRRIG